MNSNFLLSGLVSYQNVDYSSYCPLHRMSRHILDQCIQTRDLIYDLHDQNMINSPDHASRGKQPPPSGGCGASQQSQQQSVRQSRSPHQYNQPQQQTTLQCDTNDIHSINYRSKTRAYTESNWEKEISSLELASSPCDKLHISESEIIKHAASVNAMKTKEEDSLCLNDSMTVFLMSRISQKGDSVARADQLQHSTH